MNDTLIICLTAVVLAGAILFWRAKNTYVDEIIETKNWCRPEIENIYRTDYIIERTYNNGQKRIYINKVYT